MPKELGCAGVSKRMQAPIAIKRPLRVHDFAHGRTEIDRWAVWFLQGKEYLSERRCRSDRPKVVEDGVSNFRLQRKLLYATPLSSMHSKSLVPPIQVFELQSGYFGAAQSVHSS